MKKLSFLDVINRNLTDNSDFSKYLKGTTPMPDGRWSGPIVVMLYYLEDFERAREVSYRYSMYLENLVRERYNPLLINHWVGIFFESALYRSLAQRPTEATVLWKNVIEKRRMLSDKELLKYRVAQHWIYEAYALTKLERYAEIFEPAQKGFEGIIRGKATFKAPHKNTREYGLATVLIALANYHSSPSIENLQQVQKALTEYKKENVRYGRLGYDVIFDLQISYPNIITPVLPAEDPKFD